jgi:hypothetical protein
VLILLVRILGGGGGDILIFSGIYYCVENMLSVSLEEAQSVARVFGEIRQRITMLLTAFQPAATKYEAMKTLQKDEIPYPRASLYRDVDRLNEAGFLQVVDEKRFVRGSLDNPMLVYGISIKGRIAAMIHCYILSSDPKTRLKERNRAKAYLKFSGLQEFPLLVDLLKWHREREIDLSRARIDMVYLVFTLLLAAGEHPEHVTEPDLRKCAESMRKMIDESQRSYADFLRNKRQAKPTLEE